MKNTILALSCVAVLAISGCSKDDKTPVNTTPVSEQEVISQFVSVLANPNYADIQAKATILGAAVDAFIATPTDANLAVARQAWKDVRQPWESCEGFLFGPVEDNDYDPTMDSWPLNRADVDALLAGNDALSLTGINALDGTAKGFHAIEYIIFGTGGRKAADITPRQKTFLSLTTRSLLSTTTQLRDSWAPTAGNFSAEVTTAGSTSKTFKTRQAFFVAYVKSMGDICEEVGTGKMQEPYAARDSSLDESSYSHNTTIDFKNNITGILNAYQCQYNGVTGTASLSTLVASKNAALDAKLKLQINTAISSFSLITETYEKAIYDQRDQIKQVQAAIDALHTTISVDLDAFIRANIKD